MNRNVGMEELQRRQGRSHPDRLLSLAECAERTGHKVSTWRAWILRRQIPYHKIRRSVRILESDLDKLIQESRIPVREEH
jgi:excisionase family DNA binding protein